MLAPCDAAPGPAPPEASVEHTLQDHEPFRRLSEAGRRRLQAGVVSRHCASAAPLLGKGQRASGAYFVLAGRLRVYAIAPDGSEATLYFIDPGQTCVFALNSLFNDLLYPAWVQAVEETTLAVIPGAVFRELFADEPVMRDLTVRALSTLVFRLMDELEQVHACTLAQRLANFLLEHASSAGDLAMTQQQIAQHLGTTREVVARLMRRFVAAGWVATQRGRVCIRDAQALARVRP